MLGKCLLKIRTNKKIFKTHLSENFNHWDLQTMQHQITSPLSSDVPLDLVIQKGLDQHWNDRCVSCVILPILDTSFLIPAFQIISFLIIFLVLHILFCRERNYKTPQLSSPILAGLEFSNSNSLKVACRDCRFSE